MREAEHKAPNFDVSILNNPRNSGMQNEKWVWKQPRGTLYFTICPRGVQHRTHVSRSGQVKLGQPFDPIFKSKSCPNFPSFDFTNVRWGSWGFPVIPFQHLPITPIPFLPLTFHTLSPTCTSIPLHSPLPNFLFFLFFFFSFFSSGPLLNNNLITFLIFLLLLPHRSPNYIILHLFFFFLFSFFFFLFSFSFTTSLLTPLMFHPFLPLNINKSLFILVEPSRVVSDRR